MFATVIRAMRDDEVDGLSRAALVGRVEDVRRARAAMAAYEARLVRAIDGLDDGGLDGRGVLRSNGRVSGKTARGAAATAHGLATLPNAEAALADGRITAEHASALVDAAEKVDPAAVDTQLVGLAESGPADIAAKRIREWVTHHSRKTPKHALEEQHRQRTLKRWDDDTTGLAMYLLGVDQTQAAAIDARLNQRTRQLWDADGGRDGAPDLVRTGEQRAADALVELLTEAPRTGDAAPHPKYTLAATFDVRDLSMDDGRPVASLVKDGTALPVEVLERLACESSIVPVLFDGPAKPIWVGRDHRTATMTQWKALIARDRGCIGCGAAPHRCHAHHVTWWEHHGPTDIDNLVLVCTRCHHDIHDRGHTLHRVAGRWIIRPPAPPPASNGRRPAGDAREDPDAFAAMAGAA